jgi:AraC family transcriptional regulator
MTPAAEPGFHGRTLIHRETEGFVFRELVHQPGSIAPHAHEHAHLAFMLRGRLTETCEKKRLECRPSSVSYLAPGLTHADLFPVEVRCLIVELLPSRQELLSEVLPLSEPSFLDGGPASWLMARLYEEARCSDDASGLAIEGLTLEVLAEVARARKNVSGAIPPRWLRQAREFLHARCFVRTTHAEIARLVGVHPAHLATGFRKYFGCTIGQYVRRMRVESACRMLAGSDSALADIALAAGFVDQSHFTRVFKRITGMTPARYRASRRRR